MSTNSDKARAYECKGLSGEIIELAISNNSLNPGLDYFGNPKTLLKFFGSLKQDKLTLRHNNVLTF